MKKGVKEILKTNSKSLVISSIAVLAIILSISLYLNNQMEDSYSPASDLDTQIKVDSKGVKYIVDPSKILGGGPGKGSIGKTGALFGQIPALGENNIKFVSVEEADAWIEDNELVLALIYKGVERVYPLQIMTWHEIANDRIEGDPIVVTYCPLCGSGIAFEGYIEVKGQKTETRFGTSGKLYNSNLVMYDEETDTYWTQIDGRAIVGELTDQELKEISIDTVVWRDWKTTHPNSEVLSQDTGISRNYGNDPYGSYYEDSFVFFPVEARDNRIHPKTVIFGIEINGSYLAVQEEDLKQNPTIKIEFAGKNILIERSQEGIVKFTNQDTSEEIIKERDFWFAWYAFHPNTELYTN